MDSSGASLGSGKVKLAVIKESSSEQMFAFTFTDLAVDQLLASVFGFQRQIYHVHHIPR